MGFKIKYSKFLIVPSLTLSITNYGYISKLSRNIKKSTNEALAAVYEGWMCVYVCRPFLCYTIVF